MKHLLLIPICLCFFQLNGQSLNSGEFIAVLGKATDSYVPDMVTFNFSISVTEKKQNDAILKLNIQIEKTINIISRLGYDSKEIKLSDYNLGEDINYYGEKPKNNGYKASIDLELEIEYLDNKFNAFIDSISANKIPDLHFTYRSSFSDNLKDKIKKELISKASDDAQNIAQILAKSRNVALGDIFSIEYTDNNFSLYGQSVLPPPPPPAEMYDANVVAPKISARVSMREILTQQQVRIIYRIKKQ
jgi:uncharacterized protein YggE